MTTRAGGHRKGAGRPKGSSNLRTMEVATKLSSEGMTPLEFLCMIFRDEEQPVNLRCDAAKAAAPYIHPRLASIEMTGKDGEDLMPKEVTITFVKADQK